MAGRLPGDRFQTFEGLFGAELVADLTGERKRLLETAARIGEVAVRGCELAEAAEHRGEVRARNRPGTPDPFRLVEMRPCCFVVVLGSRATAAIASSAQTSSSGASSSRATPRLSSA
jgi:hypothetical protein